MLREIAPAIRSTIVLAVFTGLVFPAAITLIAQVCFPSQAKGSLVYVDGRLLGSKLLAQGFSKPEYFHPRPSAAGSGYAGEASGGTNLGPTSKKFLLGDETASFQGVKQLTDAYRKENELSAEVRVPVDAVTRSASGLDPHITPANAQFQVRRVAKARGLQESQIADLVIKNTDQRDLGFLGEPGVNVLNLNLALDGLKVSAAK